MSGLEQSLLAACALAAVILVPTVAVRAVEKRNARRADARLSGVRARDVETLLALVLEEGDRYKRRRLVCRVIEIICRFALPLATLAVLIVARLLGAEALSPTLFLGWTVAQLLLSMALLTPLSLLSYETCLHRRAFQQLCKSNDVRAAGPVIEALASKDRELRRLAVQRLTRLLPRLREHHITTVSAEQLTVLHRELSSSARRYQRPLALAILKALESIGDNSSIAHVRRLAESRSQGGGHMARSARRCLDRMQARLSSQRESRTLLRPVADSDETRRLLVRASESCPPARPETLLRTV